MEHPLPLPHFYLPAWCQLRAGFHPITPQTLTTHKRFVKQAFSLVPAFLALAKQGSAEVSAAPIAPSAQASPRGLTSAGDSLGLEKGDLAGVGSGAGGSAPSHPIINMLPVGEFQCRSWLCGPAGPVLREGPWCAVA